MDRNLSQQDASSRVLICIFARRYRFLCGSEVLVSLGKGRSTQRKSRSAAQTGSPSMYVGFGRNSRRTLNPEGSASWILLDRGDLESAAASVERNFRAVPHMTILA